MSETKSPAEVARELAHAWFNRKEFIIDGNVILSASSNPEVLLADYVAAAITTALENERERAAGYIEAKVDQLAEGNIHELTADEALRIATAIRGK